MALFDDLLSLARHLVDRNPGAAIEADLRRAVSTAYYSLFHLLVHEATARIVALPDLRPRVIRAFEHRDMKRVCQEYINTTVDPVGQPIPPGVKLIAQAFVELQQARQEADYNTAVSYTHTEADTQVQLAEVAFAEWTTMQAEPAANAFLTELLFKSILRNR